MGQLGAHTFSVQKFPAIFIGGHEGWEKYWRRKNITWQQIQALKEKATLAQNIAVETYFGRDPISSRFAIWMSMCRCWACRRILSGEELESRTRARHHEFGRGQHALGLRVGQHGREKIISAQHALGERVKYRGINYSVVGVLESKASRSEVIRTHFSPFQLARDEPLWRDISQLVHSHRGTK